MGGSSVNERPQSLRLQLPAAVLQVVRLPVLCVLREVLLAMEHVRLAFLMLVVAAVVVCELPAAARVVHC